MSDQQQQYLALWLIAIMTGISFYQIGYHVGTQEHYTPVQFKCHKGIVYRGVHTYWESTGQKCLTPEQMKGMT